MLGVSCSSVCVWWWWWCACVRWWCACVCMCVCVCVWAWPVAASCLKLVILSSGYSGGSGSRKRFGDFGVLAVVIRNNPDLRRKAVRVNLPPIGRSLLPGRTGRCPIFQLS